MSFFLFSVLKSKPEIIIFDFMDLVMVPHSKTPFKNIAILLAAGRGQRLMPHTAYKPKPLHKVSNVPVIEYMFDALKKANVTNVIVVVNYLGEQIRNHLERKYCKYFKLEFTEQQNLHGNLEAISSAFDCLEKQSIIANNVIICATDYVVNENIVNDLIKFHALYKNDISVILRKLDSQKASASSVTFFNNKQQIIKILEKPTGHFENPIISTALIYYLPFKWLYFFKNEYEKNKLSNSVTVLNQLIAIKSKVYGMRVDNLTDINLNNIELD